MVTLELQKENRYFTKVCTLCLQSAHGKYTDNWGRGEPIGSYVGR